MKKWIITSVVAVVVCAGVLAFTWTRRAPAQPDQRPAAPATVAVVKTDLADTREFKATLGFGASRQVTGRRPGTLTWLPSPGAVIDRGQPLYKVDNRPVWLFFGDTPLWRKLDAGLKGPDVKIVKDNLAALGYKLGGAADEYTPATVDAVKRWQKAQKVEENGVLEPGDVVVVPGQVRVEAVTAQPSAAAVGALMSVTATGKAVAASVDARQAETFKKDLKVAVLLPNGKEVAGTVRSVSTAVKEQKNGNGENESVVDVDIGLDEGAGELESGPVRVRVTSVARSGVLAVPVTALLALREGGYAVQKEDGQLLAVKTGLFAGGLVEISGGGLSEGLKVVTTS